MKKILWKTVIVQRRQRKKTKVNVPSKKSILHEQNPVKNYHCAMKRKKKKSFRKTVNKFTNAMNKILWKTVIVQWRQRKNEKKDFLFFFFFPFLPSKLPREVFCCNPSKKDSLDKIKTSQSIWKEFLKTISQPTHQSKMQVAIFISKNPIELCFLKPFFLFWQNLKWQKNPFANVKKFSHLLWENSLFLNVYFLVFIKAKKDKHCWKIKVAFFSHL